LHPDPIFPDPIFLLVDAILRGEFVGEVGGYELADLGEDRQLGLGWFMIFHQADPEWDRPPVTR